MVKSVGQPFTGIAHQRADPPQPNRNCREQYDQGLQPALQDGRGDPIGDPLDRFQQQRKEKNGQHRGRKSVAADGYPQKGNVAANEQSGYIGMHQNRRYQDGQRLTAPLLLGDAIGQQNGEEVEESVQIFESIVKTGNEVLDVILTEKKSVLQRKRN